MIDALSLDQLRTFVAAVDAGSFSAAGRKLRRSQSVVSQTIGKLEAQIGVRLFDRAGRIPSLTAEGRALLAEARGAAAAVDGFKARARALSGGLEPELSVVVDVMFPMERLTCAVASFQREFPTVTFRLYVEGLGAVVEPVLAGRVALGIMGWFPSAPAVLQAEHVLDSALVVVAAPGHPLAALRGRASQAALARHVQLVLADRSQLTAGQDFGVFSPKTWRLADLGAKHAFLRAGLGWGMMPRTVVAPDLEHGTLVRLRIAPEPAEGYALPMSAIYRAEAPPGPAGRWLIERLKETLQPPEPARVTGRRAG